jgi:hypothetical protein
MINHFRTLLLNAPPHANDVYQYTGDEFVEPSFVPVKVDGYSSTGLRQLRDRLFGVSPDRLFTNFRVRQILSLIDATDLRDYVKYHDSRVTYDLRDQQFIDRFPSQPIITGNSLTDSFQVQGEPASPDRLGISNHSFLFSASGNTLRVTRTGRFLSEDDVVLQFDGGLSQSISLGSTGYNLRINESKYVDGSAAIRVWLRPTLDMSDIAKSLTSLPADTYLYLFGTGDHQPYTTFRNCWETHPQLPYRVAGLLLAYVFRLSELRETGSN